MDLNELLKDKSPITRKTYISKINLLKNKFYPKDDKCNFIKKPEQVIKHIDDITLASATKKSFFIALYVVSDAMKLENKKLYYDKMIELKNINNKERKDNKVDIKKMNDYASLKELENMVKQMPEETTLDLQHKLLLALYVLQPPLRNDYASVKILYKKPKEDKGNYFIIRKKSAVFHLNEYKTKDIFKKQVYKYSDKLNKDIYKLLKLSLEKEPRDFLFTKKDKPLTETDISKLIPALFSKYINKHITINMLRQIYETNLIQSPLYNNLSLNQKEEMHKKLLHSFNTAQEYNKINNKKIIVSF